MICTRFIMAIDKSAVVRFHNIMLKVQMVLLTNIQIELFDSPLFKTVISEFNGLVIGEP